MSASACCAIEKSSTHLCFDIGLEVIGQQIVIRSMRDAVKNIREEVLVAKVAAPNHIHSCLELRIQLQAVSK